ncbi:uncharacterized protein BO72DRAFT_274243 [Aspergillus fijiensis CBS 313.89]|uniref:Uncharacterized protein n=1 Tax=Aspergillus fijiensis CBS 313.89 TaxID=1448319 RepID=A0A8G1VTU9_9EURO|nr:uncharacterized protein BO72DRAFT_274243 [Aspergillus fijiensis CBS 313.89]RAK72467.1 hypothetical protein BO72DRAFT_274243 [Aspergillus fijiensis CBS 313.89]
MSKVSSGLIWLVSIFFLFQVSRPTSKWLFLNLIFSEPISVGPFIIGLMDRSRRSCLGVKCNRTSGIYECLPLSGLLSNASGKMMVKCVLDTYQERCLELGMH